MTEIVGDLQGSVCGAIKCQSQISLKTLGQPPPSQVSRLSHSSAWIDVLGVDGVRT